MSSEITAALIAGIVSLIVSLFAGLITISQAKMERAKLERQLERQLTERLYGIRLEHYPRAFQITANLGKGNSFEQIQEIRGQLKEWESAEVSMIISQRAKQAYYNLLEAIKKNPEKGTIYGDEQLSKIWRLRNLFRGELRQDLGFLFTEDDNTIN